MAPGLGAQRGLTAAFSGSSGCLQQFLSIAEMIFFFFQRKNYSPTPWQEGPAVGQTSPSRCLQPGLAASHPQKGKSKGLLGNLHTSHTFPQVFLGFCASGTAAGVGSPWSRGCRAQPPELCQPFPGKALLAPKALPCSPHWAGVWSRPCGQPRGAGVPTAGETEARRGSVLGMGQSSFLEKQLLLNSGRSPRGEGRALSPKPLPALHAQMGLC